MIIFIINYRLYYCVFILFLFSPEFIHLLKFIHFIYNDQKTNYFTLITWDYDENLLITQPPHASWNKYCEFNAFLTIRWWYSKKTMISSKSLMLVLILFLFSVPLKILKILYYIINNYQNSFSFTLVKFYNDEFKRFKIENLQTIIIINENFYSDSN